MTKGDRNRIEQAIARGVPNHRLMADYQISYRSLSMFIDEMAAEPKPRTEKPRRIASCGTEAAWQRHRRKRESCVACESEHAVKLRRRAESRRAWNAERRFRGVA